MKFSSTNKIVGNQNFDCIKYNSDSRETLSVPKLIKTYGKGPGKKSTISILPKVIRTIYHSKKSYTSVKKNNINNNNNHITAGKLDEFKNYAASLGIDDIGFATVDESMIFKDHEILFRNAIVITLKMDKNKVKLAPSLKTADEIFLTYLNLGTAVNKLAQFLRDNGFNSQPGPALGGDVIYPILAEKAGLGALGKHGLLITPDYGPSIRIAAVYTNIDNLPSLEVNDHLWIKKFCEKCNRCIKKCPAQAIYIDPFIYPNGSKKCIDYKKCSVPFSKNYNCTVCIKECTFFKGDYYKVKENFHDTI
jgi:epoxyqueuosine reductase QueG